MLNAVLEDVSLELRSSLLTLGRVQASLTLLSLNRSLGHYLLVRILLGTQNDGFRAVFTVDFIQCLVEAFHLLMTLCIVVDEVRLNAIVWTDAHDDDSSTLVVIALTEDALRTTGGGLHDLLGRIGGGEKSFLSHVPVLRQVFTEMVGVDEDTNGLGYRLLFSQLLGTAGSKVGDAGA